MDDPIILSRLQFAITALYHFLFVPLTIGMALLLAIMESIYVMTGRDIWKRITKFWGILFGINFAMGVATGITMEFQFGTNWAYYSHYVGDVFGPLLAIEGMMAFFLEATFVGLFFFGWDRLSRVQHLMATWMVAIGTSGSALWILVANAWMQNPVGSHFNTETMRMEMLSLYDIFFNPVAQVKFVHTISASYTTGAMFVLSISAWYLMRRKHVDFAKRSMTVAASFGLASALCVVVLGDESGYTTTDHQQMKLAAVEGLWETEPPPSSFTVIGWPDMEERKTHYGLHIPWALGLIATRSLDTPVPGMIDLEHKARDSIRIGMHTYDALQRYRKDQTNLAALAEFKENESYLGYGMLLKQFTDDVINATDEEINAAAASTIPNVPVLFWSFRGMVFTGFYLVVIFAIAFYFAAVRTLDKHPWFMRLTFYSLPLPWIAAELGWIVAEYGRQPWAIEGLLPTAAGVSSVSAGQVWASLSGFIIFYTALAIVDVYLLCKYIKRGPLGD